MRRTVFALCLLAAGASACLADGNSIAPTPPPGDNSNRIATTNFVQTPGNFSWINAGVAASLDLPLYATTPASGALLTGAMIGTSGGVLCLLNTSCTRSAAQNISLAITGAVTTDTFGLQVLTDNTISASQIYEWAVGTGAPSLAPAFDAVRGVAHLTSGSTILTATGVAGYIISDAPTIASAPAAAAVFGVAVSDCDGCSVWGLDTILTDNKGQTASVHGSRFLTNELDCNVTSLSTSCGMLNIGGTPLVANTISTGVTVWRFTGYPTPAAQWAYAFATQPGATQIFAQVGAQQYPAAANIPSQQVQFCGYNNSSSLYCANMYAQTSASAPTSLLHLSGLAGFSVDNGGFYAADANGLTVGVKLLVAGTGASAFLATDAGYTAITLGNATATLTAPGPIVFNSTIKAGASAGVTCPTGSPSASFATVNGIVTHC